MKTILNSTYFHFLKIEYKFLSFYVSFRKNSIRLKTLVSHLCVLRPPVHELLPEGLPHRFVPRRNGTVDHNHDDDPLG